MNQETKTCKNCAKDFEIRKEDLIFYEQVKVPPPSHCPDCRMQKRIAFRNERTLYKRPCDMCKKDGVSLYTKNTPFPVFCHECWWGDGWDPMSYGIKYNPENLSWRNSPNCKIRFRESGSCPSTASIPNMKIMLRKIKTAI